MRLRSGRRVDLSNTPAISADKHYRGLVRRRMNTPLRTVTPYDPRFERKKLHVGFVLPPAVCRNIDPRLYFQHTNAARALDWTHPAMLCIPIARIRPRSHAAAVDALLRPFGSGAFRSTKCRLTNVQSFPPGNRAGKVVFAVQARTFEMNTLKQSVIPRLTEAGVQLTCENIGFPFIPLGQTGRYAASENNVAERIEAAKRAIPRHFTVHFLALFEELQVKNTAHDLPPYGSHNELRILQYYALK